MSTNSQNGKKMRLLSPMASEALARIKTKPVPTNALNPGIVKRLLREGCVEIVDLPSPYETRSGTVQHLRFKASSTEEEC